MCSPTHSKIWFAQSGEKFKDMNNSVGQIREFSQQGDLCFPSLRRLLSEGAEFQFSQKQRKKILG